MKAIVNGRVKTMAGPEYEKGTVLFENGKICAVGAAEEITVPADAEVIDAGGRLVMPGFVDAHSHLGLWDEIIGFRGSDGNEITDPVTPQLRAIDSIYPLDPPFKLACQGGVTTVVTGPGSANVIGGQFAAIKTSGVSVDEMLVKFPVAMKCAFGENPKVCYNERKQTPTTRMGIAAVMRETLLMTKDYLARKEAAAGDPSKAPAFNMKYEAMIPVVKGELPLKVHAHRCDDILTAIRIAKEFGLKLTLDHCTEGHLIAKQVKESGFDALIGPSYGEKSKPELKNKGFETAAALYEAGVKIAIITDSPVLPQEGLPMFAAMAMQAGLPREEALKAISINAAEITGIDEFVGSLETGKDADIVIWEDDPFTLGARTNRVIIRGETVYTV
ncbi:MAG: amidohydrolase [Clostridia bacterium]|nr:amidohydrolase [Clostridia bacterium]